MISYDGRTWKHIETFTYDAAEPKLTFGDARGAEILDSACAPIHGEISTVCAQMRAPS